MDECTANVDAQTASVIQNTISTECRGMTVITIAHRISMVLNMDNILILDHGILVRLSWCASVCDCVCYACMSFVIDSLFPPQLLYSKKEKKSVINFDNIKYLVVWTTVRLTDDENEPNKLG